MSELPDGWALVKLDDVGQWGSGGTPTRTNLNYYNGGTIPWLVIGDLDDDYVRKAATHITEEGLKNSSAKLVPAGTILVAMYGSIGKLGIAAFECATNQAIAFCKPNPQIVTLRYLYYTLYWAKPILLSLGQGGAQQNISQGVLREFQVPLAPQAEQTRIVDQLDKLLARVQACNERIDAIPSLLKRFRQAVLDAATSGILTEDWRVERMARITPQAEFRTVVRDSAQLHYAFTATTDSEAEDWQVTTVSQIASAVFDGPFGSHLKSDDYSEAGVRVVRLENIGWLSFAADKETFIPEEKYESLVKHTLQADDVLLSSFIAEEVRVCLAPTELDRRAINKADCFCIRVNQSKCIPKFLALRLACKSTYSTLKNSVHGATRPRINLGQLRAFEFPLPSLIEQAEIVRRVEALFKLADRIEARYTAARAQAQRLIPLLLAKAFRGELVQQDPQDEPASLLLQRIAATQPAKAQASRGRPRAQSKAPPAPPVLKPTDWTSLPNGAWVAPADPDGQAAVVWLTAVLRAWGEPMPEREARLASLLCQQPRIFTAVLPAAQATQWSRLVGDEARPLPTQVLRLQPAINNHWGRAIKGMRARDDLVEAGLGDGITWALGPGTASIETAGWPDGRAGFVVAYLRAHGIISVLPSLAPSAREFVDVRAA